MVGMSPWGDLVARLGETVPHLGNLVAHLEIFVVIR
jgi:hypothetical protein